MRQAEILARHAAIRAYGSKKLNAVFSAVKRSTDMERIRRLKREMASIHAQDPYCAAKYADFRNWLLRDIHRAGKLGLHQQSDLRILDIGCGPGYFIATANALGHDCCGIDVPDSWLSPVELRVYGELLGALGCQDRVSPMVVERFVPMSCWGRYDLITAFLVCFNRHEQPDQWGVEEWKFFISDALEKLSPGGRLFLGLNENPKRYGKLEFYDQALLDYFLSVGTVDRARVLIVNQARVRPQKRIVSTTA